jgi:manganese oxidase
VRDDVRPGDYRDPGWFKHPADTVASEYTVEEGDAVPRAPRIKADDHTLDVRKPGPHEGH